MAITRPAYSASLETLEPQLTMIYMKQDSEPTNYTLLGQVRKFEVTAKAPEKTYRRVGSVTATQSRGATEVTATIAIYMQHTIEELAALLGQPKPTPGGWVGSETVRLDGTKKVDLKAVTFASTDTGAAEYFTEFLVDFGPSEIKPGVDADGDARVIEIAGAANDYYITPVAHA